MCVYELRLRVWLEGRDKGGGKKNEVIRELWLVKGRCVWRFDWRWCGKIFLCRVWM